MKKLKNTFLSAMVVALGMPAFAQTYVNHSVNQAPQLAANAGNALNFCAGDSIALGGNPSAVGGTAPVTYAWSPPNGLGSTTTANPQASPVGTTSYSLQITDAENCTSTSSLTLTLVTPVAAFGALPNLLVVGFTDQSTAATTWAWDFGDGGNSTLQNPTHTYTAAGNYAVCLTINGATNCEAIFCDSINVVSVGIGNALPGASVHVYPNPATGNQINFEIQGAGMSDAIQIELFDQQGKLVHEYQGAANQLIHTLNRKELSAGAYQYRVRSGDGLLGTGKVVLR